MNRIFKVIWNHATQTWVAVSELQSTKGKTKSKTTAVVATTAVIALGGLGTTLEANAAKVTGTLGQEITSKDKFGREITSTSSNAKDYSPVYGKVLNSSMFDVAVNDIAIGSNVTAMGKIGFYRAGQDEPTDGKGRIGSAIGIGSNIITYGSPSVAIGYTLVNESPQTVLIGSNSTLAAGSNHTMMVGLVNSVATKSNHSSLYGNFNKLGEESSNSVLAGANNTVGNKSSSATVVGSFNTLGNQSSITAAIGTRNTIKDNTNNTVVLAGFSTIGADGVNTDRSILVGFQSNVSKNNAIGIGSYTNATENNAIAIGNSSTSSKSSAIAIGNSSTSSGLFAVAIGSNSNSSNAATIALGASANASGDRSVAIGVSANATGSYSNAFGRTAVVNGENSTTIGTESTVSGNKSVGIGYKNSVTGHNTVVLGNNVTATTSGSVILGESASTTGSHNVVTESSATINGISYSGFRGTVADVGHFVSVGKVGDERKIINVAAGNISATSTDAINGSQLYLLTANSGWKLDIGAINGGTNSRNVTADGDHEFIKSNDLVKFIAGKNIDIAQNNGEITISAKDPVTTGGSYSFKVKGGDDQPSTVTNAKTVSFQSSSPNMLGVSLDHNGGNPNVLFELKTATNPKIARDPDGSGGQVSLDDAKKKPGVVTTEVLAKTINNTFWRGKVATQAGSTGESNTAENKQMEVSPGEEVILEAGNNINIQLDSDNNKYTISAKAPETASLTKSNNGNITVPTGNEGSKLVNATTVANAINNVSHKVATLNSDTQVQADENNVNGKEVKAGDKINFIAGKNLLVKQGTSTTADGHNITFSLDKDITVNNITANNLTMGNVKINKDTGINAGDKKITNVSDGTIGANSKDAINGGQLYSELNAHKWKLTTDVDGGERAQTDDKKSVEEIGKNDTITVKAGKNVIIKQAGKNITISAKDVETATLTPSGNGDVTNPATEGNKLVNATTVANALNNVSWSLQEKGVEKDKVSAGNIVNFVDGTGTKINITTTNNNSTVKYDVDFGSITVTETTGAISPVTDENKVASTKNVADAIKKSGWIAKVDGDNATGSSNEVVNPGETVIYKAGKNMKVAQNGANFTYSTLDNVEFTKVTTNELKAGPVTINTNGIDAGNKTITNVSNGVNPNDAVNKSQLDAHKWKITTGEDGGNAEGTSVDEVGKGDLITVKAGKNVIIKQAGKDITISAKDVETTGLTVTDGSISSPIQTESSKLVNATTVANAINNVSHKVATLNSDTQVQANENNDNGKEVKAGDKINFIAGKNLLVKQGASTTADGHNITFSLDKDITVNNITANNLTMGNVKINKDTGINAGDKKITNVSDGTIGANSKDAINGGQLYSELNAHKWKLTTDVDGGERAQTDDTQSVEEIGKGDTITVKAGKNVIIKQAGKNITISAKDAETTGLTVTNGNVSSPSQTEGNKLVNATTVANALNNVSWSLQEKGVEKDKVSAGNIVNFVDGTGTKINITTTNNNSTVKYDVDFGSITVTETTGAISPVTDENKVASTKNVADAIKKSGWVAKVDGDNATGSSNEVVNPGETVIYKAGKNMKVAQNGANFTYSTLDNVEFTKVTTNELKAGPVTINTNGIDAGNKTITNVSNSVNPNDAVNKSQLDAHKWKLTTGTEGSGTQTGTVTEESVGKDDLITFKAGDNVIIKQAGKNITISAKDIETATLTPSGKGDVTNPATDGNKLVNATTVANALNNVSWSLQEKGVEKDKVSAGNIVNFVDGTGTKINITTNNNNSTVKYDVDFGSITVNEADGKAPTITEGNKVASTANVVEAINKSGWKLVGNNTASTEVNTVVNPGEGVKFIDGNNTKAIIDVTDTSAPTVKINVETTVLTENTTTKGKIDAPTTSGDKLVNATTVANAINKSGWNLDVGRVDDNALTQDEEKDEKSLISPGEDVSLKAGKNLRIKKQGNDVIYATKDNVTFSTIQLGDNTGPNITHNNGDIQFSKPDGSAVKLTNVANGTENNDAVNVSQLNAHKWKLTTGTEGSGTQAGTAMEESVGKDDLITFKAGDNVIIKQAGKNITISAKSAETTALTLTNGNVTSPSQTEGNKLVNATTVANALNNVSWGLASDGTKISDIKAGNTVDFADGTGTDAAVTSENGITVVKFNAKTDGKTINVGKDGNITAVTGNIINSADNSGKVAVPTDEGDKLVNQTTVVNAINNISHKVATLNNNEQVGENQNNADGVATKAGDKLNFIAGKNLLVKQQGHNITFSLDKDISVNNVTASNLTVGPVQVTSNGIDAGGKTITNVTAGVNGTDAVNVSQLNNATGNLTNKGLNFAGDNGDASHRNLGETLTIKGGATGTLTNNNIGVTSDGKGTLKVELAKDVNLTPNGSLKVGDVTINENGINAGGDKISNIADGDISPTSKYAVNGSQLYEVKETAEAGWSLSANGANSSTVKPRSSVDLNNSDGNIKIAKEANSNNVTFNLAPVVKIGGDTNKITIDGNNGTIGGLTNKKFKPGNITSGQAASEDQLDWVYNNLTKSINDSVNSAGFNLEGKVVEGSNGHFEVKEGTKDKRIDNNQNFTLDAGKNIKITQVDNGYELATTDNLDAQSLAIRGKDGKDGEPGKVGVTLTAENGVGSVGINGKDGANGEFTFAKGPAGVDGKDGETKTRIEYVPVGPNGEKGEPEQVATLEDGLKFVGNDGNVINKKLNETLGIVGGIKDPTKNTVSDKNTYVSTNEKGNLVVKIAENPEFNSVKTGNTTINNDGLTINNGPSITKDGVDAAGNKVTNIKNGDVSANSKDAVNGSQLYEVKETAEAGWNLTANGKDKSNVKPRATVDLNNKDGNVEITKSGNKVTFGLAKDIKLGDNGSVNVGGVTINKGGINAGGKTISGVADGKLGNDAVNMNQLNGVVNNVNQKLGDMNHRVNKLDKRVRGIGANAAAAASLPQVYIPGKSMIAASTGGYNGASAIAVGYSRASDNGKVILKMTGTANSAGHYSGGVGLGYQW